MACAWRVVKRWPGRCAARMLIAAPGTAPLGRSSQPPAQRQRERERVGLLAVEPVQLQPRPRRLVEDLGAGAPEIVAVAPRDGHEAAQPDLAVAGGEL